VRADEKQSGPVPPLTISRLSAKNLKVMRPNFFQYIATREEFEYWTGELFDFVINGQVNVKIHKTYPLAEVAQAHVDLEGRKTTGKLLLKL
jgi:NADPH2:quinone reductase